MTLNPNSAISKVYKAYLSGCRTTPEVAEVTGLGVRTCSAYTMELIARRLIVKTGTAPKDMQRGMGRPLYWYEPRKMQGATG